MAIRRRRHPREFIGKRRSIQETRLKEESVNRPDLYQEVRGELPEGCHDIVDAAEILEYLGRTEGGGKVYIIHREED